MRSNLARLFSLSLLPYHPMSIPARFLINVTENEVHIKESSQKGEIMGVGWNFVCARIALIPYPSPFAGPERAGGPTVLLNWPFLLEDVMGSRWGPLWL